MMQQQPTTLEPLINSSLLFTRSDGTQGFIHDNLVAFFLAMCFHLDEETPQLADLSNPTYVESLIYYCGLLDDSTSFLKAIKRSSHGFVVKYDLLTRCIEEGRKFDDNLFVETTADLLRELEKEENFDLANKVFWYTLSTFFHRIGIENTGEMLYGALESGPSRKYRAAVTYILSKSRSDKLLDAYVDYLCDGEDEPYFIIKDVLQKWHKEDPDKVFEAMKKHLLEDSGGDYKYLVRTVGELGEPRLIPYLIEFYHRSSHWLRIWSIDALARIDDITVIPQLEKLMERDPVRLPYIQEVIDGLR